MQLYDTCYFTINNDLKLIADLQIGSKSISPAYPLAWIGIATFKIKSNQNNKEQLNTDQIAVRKLLKNMLTILALDDTLTEGGFPYRLSHTRHYVCFSHSKHQISCIISRQPSAIDSEVSVVPMRIANRFYHPNEIKWLYNMHECYGIYPVSLSSANKVLWMLKECYIKIDPHNHKGLMQGLKHNFSQLADKLLQSEIQYVICPRSDVHQQINSQHTHIMNYQWCMTMLDAKNNHNGDNKYVVIYMDSHQTLLIIKL